MVTKKGRGWRGDKAAHSRAGSLGGKATAKTHGTDFFAKIGSSGGKISGGNFKNNTELARRAGRNKYRKAPETLATVPVKSNGSVSGINSR